MSQLGITLHPPLPFPSSTSLPPPTPPHTHMHTFSPIPFYTLEWRGYCENCVMHNCPSTCSHVNPVPSHPQCEGTGSINLPSPFAVEGNFITVNLLRIESCTDARCTTTSVGCIPTLFWINCAISQCMSSFTTEQQKIKSLTL